MKPLLEIVSRHKAGEAVGVYSVCSAHALVIEAACRRAVRQAGYALVEATSNQVKALRPSIGCARLGPVTFG